MIKRILTYTLLTITFAGAAFEALAQAAPNASGAFEEINDVPLDGGICVLVAAGVGYGVKKLYNKKK